MYCIMNRVKAILKWDVLYYTACRGGHVPMIREIMKLAARDHYQLDPVWGMRGAYRGNTIGAIRGIILPWESTFVTDIDQLMEACDGGHLNLLCEPRAKDRTSLLEMYVDIITTGKVNSAVSDGDAAPNSNIADKLGYVMYVTGRKAHSDIFARINEICYARNLVLDWENLFLGACLGGKLDVVKFVLDHRANSVNIEQGIIRACVQRRTEVVKYLIELGPVPRWEFIAPNAYGSGDFAIIKIVRKYYRDITQNALLCIAARDRVDVMQYARKKNPAIFTDVNIEQMIQLAALGHCERIVDPLFNMHSANFATNGIQVALRQAIDATHLTIITKILERVSAEMKQATLVASVQYACSRAQWHMALYCMQDGAQVSRDELNTLVGQNEYARSILREWLA